MTSSSLRRWSWVHKWSSLVSTVFLLLLCLTGLPLLFHHEIGHWLGTEPEPQVLPADTPQASLDAVLAVAQARHTGLVPQYLYRDPGETATWSVTLGPTPDAVADTRTVVVDARTTERLAEPRDEGFLYVMLRLHLDLFAELPGKLFLGVMAFLLLAALVSGVVLYAPFMHKLAFGEVRRERSARVRWLDLHNLVGIVTLVWVFVVGATGMLNTWADLVVRYWQSDQMAAMTAPYRGLPPPRQLASLAAAVAVAQAREPAMTPGFIAFPGTALSSPHHYGVFMRGTRPLEARLFKPALIDATTGTLTDSRSLPWYVTALLVSQPLHFGDYAGLPLRIVWALLDLLTIGMLVSGLYLWWVKRRLRPDARQSSLDEVCT